MRLHQESANVSTIRHTGRCARSRDSGDISAGEGCRTFLRAARIVLDQLPNTAFLLVGHGELKADLERLAVELGIRSSVFFSDGRGAVSDYLARMSIACLTSKSEGLPNAILEYMAAGLPVVATDVGGVSELVEDGMTGYLIRDRTPGAVAAPIIRLLADGTLRATMGRMSLERGRTQFDMDAAVKRLEGFYIDAVGNRALLKNTLG